MVLGFFPGVKHLRHEDDQSPPPSSEVKDKRSYTCTLLIHLHCMKRGYLPFYQGSNLPFYQSTHIYQFQQFTQTGMDTRRHWKCGHSFKMKQCTHLHQLGLICQIRTKTTVHQYVTEALHSMWFFWMKINSLCCQKYEGTLRNHQKANKLQLWTPSALIFTH